MAADGCGVTTDGCGETGNVRGGSFRNTFFPKASSSSKLFALTSSSSSRRRYKAIMSPLSERSGKLWAKATVAFVWLAGVTLALPIPFFFEFTFVLDEINGGVKPFCQPRANPSFFESQREEEDDVDVDVDRHEDAVYILAAEANETHDGGESRFEQRVTPFQAYNFALSILQVRRLK